MTVFFFHFLSFPLFLFEKYIYSFFQFSLFFLFFVYGIILSYVFFPNSLSYFTYLPYLYFFLYLRGTNSRYFSYYYFVTLPLLFCPFYWLFPNFLYFSFSFLHLRLFHLFSYFPSTSHNRWPVILYHPSFCSLFWIYVHFPLFLYFFSLSSSASFISYICFQMIWFYFIDVVYLLPDNLIFEWELFVSSGFSLIILCQPFFSFLPCLSLKFFPFS